MANGIPENISKEQADSILSAETFEEKSKLAREAGFSEEVLSQLNPETRNRTNSIDGDVPLELSSTSTEEEGQEDFVVDWENSQSISPSEPEDLEELRLVQSAVIQNYLDGTPLIEGYLQYRGTRDKKDLVGALSDIKRDEDLYAVRELFLNQPGVTQEDIMTEAQISELMREQIEEESSGPKKRANAYADALASGDTDRAVQMQLAANAFLYETYVRPMAEDITLWDQIKSFGVDFIPGVQLKRNKDLTNKFFGAKEHLQNLAARLQTMDPQERVESFPLLRDALVEEVGETRAVSILAEFLNPYGDMEFDEFNTAWALVDTVDAATVVSGLASLTFKAGKSIKGISALNSVKRETEASELSALAAIDESGDSAKALGITIQDAHNNALPFNMTEIDPNQTVGLSKRVSDKIRQFAATREKTVSDIAFGRSWMRETAPLSPEEAENLALDYAGRSEGIENAQIVNRTDEGFELRYDVYTYQKKKDANGELIDEEVPIKVRTERLPIKYDPEAGEAWKVSERGYLRTFLESNTSLAGDTNFAKDVNRALWMDTTSANLSGELLKLQREALSPVLNGALSLNPKKNPFVGARASIAKIDEALSAGDKQGVEWSNVQLKEKFDLNEDQIAAYHNLRGLFDSLFDLRNFEVRRDLVKKGFKEATFSDGQFHIVQPYNDSASFKRALSQFRDDPQYLLIEDLGDVKLLNSVDIDELYNNGYRIIRAREGIKTDKVGKVRLAAVKEHQVSDLPQSVLHRRKGYVPRIYDKAAYFVKNVKPTIVDGRVLDLSNPKLAIARGADHQTLRYFDNKVDAEEWAKEMESTLPEGSREKIAVLEDREIERQAGGLIFEGGIGPSGGLYTGKRADSAIPFGKEGANPITLSSFEALTRNIQNVSNFISRNEMRGYWQEKWIKTAQSLGVNSQRFGDIPEGTNKATAAFLQKTKESINDWSGIPSESERFMEASVQRLIDRVAGSKIYGREKIISSLHNLKHKDPVAAGRAAAFHSLLGFFNPVQLWVQAQGATLALSANITNPKRMVRVLRDQSALTAIDYIDNPEVIAKVGKSLGVEDLQKVKDLWRRTGYRDSILNTADHAAAIQSYGVGADALRRLAGKGLWFYKAGELFNRRTSFLSALYEYTERTGKSVSKLTDDDLRLIMTRSNDFMLNLSKANRAKWQRGLLSLPTQFYQVNAKLIESLVGSNKRLTRQDRYKILAGQVGLYGVAGVPFGGAAYHAVAGLTGFGEEEQLMVSDDVKRAVNGGFTDWLAYNMFNADVDVANRSAIADGIERFFFDLVSDPGNAVFNFPFVSVGDRTFSAFKHIGIMSAPALSEGEIPDAGIALASIKELSKITSTGNQISKAIYMNRWNEVIDRKGRAIVEKDFSFSTELASAIGFQPRQVNMTYELEAINRANQDFNNLVSKNIVFLMNQYASQVKDKNFDDVDEDLLRHYELAIRYQYSLLRNESEEESVRNSVMNRIRTGQDRHSQALRKWIKDRANDESLRLSEWGAKSQGRVFNVYLEDAEDN